MTRFEKQCPGVSSFDLPDNVLDAMDEANCTDRITHDYRRQPDTFCEVGYW